MYAAIVMRNIRMSELVKEGTVGGFHYGNEYKGCNGLYHATNEVLPDGRQVYVCDACGTKGAMIVKAEKDDSNRYQQ